MATTPRRRKPAVKEASVTLTMDELEEAIAGGVVEAFTRLGIDCSDPQATQRDFAFLRDMRLGTKSLTTKTVWVVLSAAVLAICGFVWAGFQAAVNAGAGGATPH